MAQITIDYGTIGGKSIEQYANHYTTSRASTSALSLPFKPRLIMVVRKSDTFTCLWNGDVDEDKTYSIMVTDNTFREEVKNSSGEFGWGLIKKVTDNSLTLAVSVDCSVMVLG